MSEELRQKGYISPSGRTKGDPLGPYESFNIGATTIEQLRRATIVPDRDYGKFKQRKPDGIVVDRRGSTPIVKFLVEYKDVGKLESDAQTDSFITKVASEYCRPLACRFSGLSDHSRHLWVLVSDKKWDVIRREDDYHLDFPIDLSSDDGRDLIARTIVRLETELDPDKAMLVPHGAVNPTKLADAVWQQIWLASGEKPQECLATFIELLLFKFLSDLGILTTNNLGVAVDFETVRKLDNDSILKYYFQYVRPEIKNIFPVGLDGTSVINGIVLDDANKDHGYLFAQLLKKFVSLGSLRRIDPEFKSRVFERFLKKNHTVKFWGQHFTPRNVIKAMVEMSGIERLPPDSVVADPACGVGGFVLEPLINKRPHDFRSATAPSLKYVGWDRDLKLTILAKANMLVHLSEVLEEDPVGAVERLAPVLNQTFSYVGDALTGSLAKAPVEEWDLVLTNPPYVVRGAGEQRKALAQDERTKAYYKEKGSGVENLFMQMIIRALKPGGRALVIVPDGLLMRTNEAGLKKFLLKTCYLESIISLPSRTFFATPKKTYILSFRKKQNEKDRQSDPVFTYLVTRIGETLDAKRFTTPDNDLPHCADQFRLFQGNPQHFSSDHPRIKTIPISRFNPAEHWMVDRWWSRSEREALGDLSVASFVDSEKLKTELQQLDVQMESLQSELQSITEAGTVQGTKTVRLSDKTLFKMSIGKRVLHKDLFYMVGGPVPLYSANVERGKEHGWIHESNLADFDNPSLLWSIDSDFNMTIRMPGEVFATTDHCGRLELLAVGLDPEYCRAAITYGFATTFGFDRVLRPSLGRMKDVTIEVPIDAAGRFDLTAQRSLVAPYLAVSRVLDSLKVRLSAFNDMSAALNLPAKSV
jgi:type I restriction enzyme M protein